jgi:transcription antitermination factor NusG
MVIAFESSDIIINSPEYSNSCYVQEVKGEMPMYWYALRSKPRKEEVVWKQVLSQGFETYYPRYRVNPVNPRARKLRPYFPGYLFLCIDLDEVGLSTFKWMPHTLGLVSFGGEPATVPDNLVQAIHKHVDEINASGGEVFDGLRTGDLVWIRDGPFSGFEAIFDARLPGKERVRVLLEFLGSKRQVPLVLHSRQIERIQK